jgi:hypothetical protein
MRKIISFMLTAAVLVSASSCAKERISGGDKPGKGGDAQVMLQLRTPNGFGSSSTRGLSFANENILDNVYVLVFDKNDRLTDIKEGLDVSSNTVNPSNGIYSGEGQFQVTLPQSGGTETSKLVVLTNAEDILIATIGIDSSSSSIGSDYNTVTAKIYNTIDGKMYSTGTGHIPMWGETAQVQIKPGNNNITLQLVRAIARVDVGVGQIKARTTDATTDIFEWTGTEEDGITTIPFELKEVYVIKPNDRYAVVPASANVTTVDGKKSVTAPTVPSTAVKFSLSESESRFKFDNITGAFDNKGGWTSRDIYIPESDIVMGVGGTPGDVNHTDRMALVLGGIYDNSGITTYYRIDFAKNGNLRNVLRNHLYQFNISKVSGSGSPDVGTAYNSISMNMSVDIREWTNEDSDVIIYGSEYVSLHISRNSIDFEAGEARKAFIYRGLNSTDRIVFRTNVPLAEFAMALSNGGDFPNSADKTIIENERFRVAMKSENGVNFFEFRALKAFDPAALDNPSTLTVNVRRMSFTIEITQKDIEPRTDWLDGGGIEGNL